MAHIPPVQWKNICRRLESKSKNSTLGVAIIFPGGKNQFRTGRVTTGFMVKYRPLSSFLIISAYYQPKIPQVVVAGRSVFKIYSIDEEGFVERENLRVGKNINLNYRLLTYQLSCCYQVLYYVNLGRQVLYKIIINYIVLELRDQFVQIHSLSVVDRSVGLLIKQPWFCDVSCVLLVEEKKKSVIMCTQGSIC